MRIEAYTQIQQLYNTSKAGKTQKTTNKSFKDAVQISSAGKDFQTAKAAAFAAPDIRHSRAHKQNALRWIRLRQLCGPFWRPL